MVDKRGNYIWCCYRHKNAVYVRRDYKTVSTYGKKNNVLTDARLLTALAKVLYCQKNHDDCGVIIKTPDHIGYYVKQATFQKLGEGA